ncbi:MAG: endonuclease Q family protein [Thermoproteota archaeon]
MRVFCDMHIHSRYSRATSEMMTFQEISRYAALKGLNIVGTGDSTHPDWVKEIKEKLEQEENGLMRLKGSDSDLKFVLSCEVSTIYSKGESSKRVHHVLLIPDIECMEQVNDLLGNFGDMSSDGRPIINCSSAELVEFVSEVSNWIEIFPAHAWTPHFSIFGLRGFDSVKECYDDFAHKIHAIETGLSSDPPMNWRLSSLDKYVLVSNSDSHSPWPWRLGREANLFDLKDVSYRELILALRRESKSKILYTIETHPEYGKYHWSGHRSCGVRFSPEESKANEDICPKCGKKLTKGVEQRVNELADREKGFRPSGAAGYVHLLPLSEIIATVLGFEQVNSAKVWKIYNSLVKEFGSEFSVMLDADPEKIERFSNRKLAAAIMRVREDKVIVEPGYDGVYGKIRIDGDLSAF